MIEDFYILVRRGTKCHGFKYRYGSTERVKLNFDNDYKRLIGTRWATCGSEGFVRVNQKIRRKWREL